LFINSSPAFSSPTSAFELGYGSAYVTVSLARLLAAASGGGCIVLGADVSPAAARDGAATVAAHAARPTIDLALASYGAPFLPRLAGACDVVVFNPPYVPTPPHEVGRGGVAAAWAGGDRGRAVLDAALPSLVALMAPGGELFIVTVADNDPDDVVAVLRGMGVDAGRALERTADEERLVVLRGVKKVVGE
jgi:release factor glutamine methyltransferase